jgi:hypothetical protein
MKYLRIYEQYSTEAMPMEDPMSDVHFEAETTDFRPTDGNSEGNYIVNFQNADGEDTTIEIAGASEPEYVGSSMVSNIEMIEDSSSDGRRYSFVGYYDEVPGQDGAYELKKVLVEEI